MFSGWSSLELGFGLICAALLRPGLQIVALVPKETITLVRTLEKPILWARSQSILYCIIPVQEGSLNNYVCHFSSY